LAENQLNNFLDILQGIKNSQPGTFIIYTIVVIGTFSIQHLDSMSTTSPFNNMWAFRNPMLTKSQVQEIYDDFAREWEINIEEAVINDIYQQTNG